MRIQMQLLPILAQSRILNINHFSMEQAVKLFEELLKIEREKYNKENSKDDK